VPPDHAHEVYTHGHPEAVLRSHRWRTAENSAAYLLPHLAPGLSLLDVGCGPGTLTVDLARRVAPGRVVGVDVAEVVVDEARAHAAASGAADVSFVAGDFRTADLGPGDGFDVVHAHQVLHHLGDPVGGLAAMSALARPGGLVASRETDYGAMSWAPASAALDRWAEVYAAVARRNGAEPDAGRHLLRWARLAGLADVTYTTSTWTFTGPDRGWWSETWAVRTADSPLADQAVAYGVADGAELADLAAGWRAWGQDPDAVFTVVHGEVLARV
jgi:SAM-dependent methyltransferase